MPKERIRPDISQALGVLIPEGKWEEYIDLLDRDGKFTRKNMLTMIILLCKHVERLESVVDLSMGGMKAVLGASQPAVAFKLRNKFDIQKELDAKITEDTKVLFVSPEDFKIMEKEVTGYGKEINPKTKKEGICLYYKDLPMFRDSSL